MNIEIRLEDANGTNRLNGAIQKFLPKRDQLRSALGTTNYKMATFLRGRAMRDLPKLLNIPPAILRKRFKTFLIRSKIRGGKLFLGLNRVPFDRLQPEQVAQGTITKKGGFYERGAFIVLSRKTKSRLIVLKRRGKTWIAPGVRGKMDVVRVSIDEKAWTWLEDFMMRPDFQDEYFKRLEHELKWKTKS